MSGELRKSMYPKSVGCYNDVVKKQRQTLFQRIFSGITKTDVAALLLFLLLSLPLLTLINFTDEHEHAMSGWFLLNGLLPYRDYFHQHSPLPLFLGVLGYIIPGVEPVLMLRIFTLVFSLATWVFLMKMTSKQFRPVLYFTMLGAVLTAPTVFLHMALAGTIVSYVLLAFTMLLVHRAVYRTPKPLPLFWLYGITVFLCFWSTFVSFLPLTLLGIVLLGVLFKQHALPKVSLAVKPILFAAAINSSFLLLYTAIGSFSSFWWNTVTYNTKYYYPLHLVSTPMEGKYGFMYQIASKFSFLLWESVTRFFSMHMTLLKSLFGIRHIISQGSFGQIPQYLSIVIREYSRPYESFSFVTFLAVVMILAVLLLRKRFITAVAAFLFLTSLFFRSNEVFHWSPLVVAVIFFLGVLLHRCIRERRVFLAIFVGYASLALFWHSAAFYARTLAERPQYIDPKFYLRSEVISKYLPEKNRAMVLDVDMMDYPLSRLLPVCTYQGYTPWLSSVPTIREGLESCVRVGEPDLIIIPQPNLPELQHLMSIIVKNYEPVPELPELYIKKL